MSTMPAPEPAAAPQPQMVQPQLTPQSFMLGLIDQPDGTKLIMFQTMSHTGSHFSHMPPDVADAIGTQLCELARQARGGSILIPPPGFQLPPMQLPNGHPH